MGSDTDFSRLYRPPLRSVSGGGSGVDEEEIRPEDLHATLDWKAPDLPAARDSAPEEPVGADGMAWFRRLAADPSGRAARAPAAASTRAGQTLLDMLAVEIEAEERGSGGTGMFEPLDEE